MDERLDRFGRFVVRHLRDRMLYDADMLLKSQWKAPDLQAMQERLSELSIENRATVRALIDQVITRGMHDLLFALQEESDADGSIRVFVDGQEVANLLDGLHGEIFGDDGWIVRHSEYPAKSQMDLFEWAAKEFADLTGKAEDKDG